MWKNWKVAKTMVSNELEPNRKLFPDHLPFILHGALVGCWCTRPFQKAQAKPNNCCGSLDGLIGLGLAGFVINCLLPFAPSAVLVSVLWVNLGKNEELILNVRNTGVARPDTRHGWSCSDITTSVFFPLHEMQQNLRMPMKGVQASCKMAKFSHNYLLCYIYRKEKLKGWCEEGNEWPAADAVTLNAELSACPADCCFALQRADTGPAEEVVRIHNCNAHHTLIR